MTDLKSEAGELARAVRDAARELEIVDCYMDAQGSIYVQPPGAQFIGRYDSEASARQIAADLHFLLRRL
jgi:hypothetical protein